MNSFFKTLHIYYSSLLFESSYEIKYFKIFNVKGFQTFLPRTLVLLPYLNKVRFFFNTLFPFLYLLWVLIMPVAYLLKALFLILKHRQAHDLETTSLYLNTSQPSNLKRVKNLNKSPLPKTSLYVRNRNLNELKLLEINSISIHQLIGAKDILNCLALSIGAHFYLIIKKPNISLFSYSSFEFFLTFYAIKKVKNLKTIWLSNHFDRWLILASSFEELSTNIVQHGSLVYEKSANEVTLQLEKKIKGINKIFYIDDKSKKLFSDYIESKNVEYTVMNPLPKLKEWRKLDRVKIKILFNIGYNKIEFYTNIINDILFELSNVDIGVTYHPLQKKRINNFNLWQVDNNYMPQPDIYVSYGSSLDEYFYDHDDIRLIIYNLNTDSIRKHILIKILNLVKENEF